jgi:phosphatidylinositol 4-kinase
LNQAIREFEVLIALCKAAPMVKTAQNAQKLARQLVPYLQESHCQVFALSPFFRKVEPSPTEALSYNVTSALLSLGVNHDDVQQIVSDNIKAYLNASAGASESVSEPDNDGDPEAIKDAIRIATIAMSLVGFMDGASAQANFWKTGGRLALIQRLRDLLSESFLVGVETAFSTIRNCHSHERHVKEWKRYLRHYSDIGRPLGAMLLQQSFMWLLVASTSLLVAEVDALREAHVLDILMSGDGVLRPMTGRTGDADFRSVETYANVVIDQVNYLESSEDFVRLDSAGQQRLAFGVKASAFISYLNCSRLNEDAADPDILTYWLGDALADPVCMADEELATTVLKCMALLCKVSPSYAGTVSRLLPRFIVQSGSSTAITAVAAECLAFVLQILSADAVITTLYTLGNVLSPGEDEKLQTFANGFNGDLPDGPDTQIYSGRHSTGSSISLQISGEEQTETTNSNVVQAICKIATAAKDEKISALAQSMLLQKLNKINSSVDAKIIMGAAELALDSGQLEFRSLLKLYTRLTQLALVEEKQTILGAILWARNHISAHIDRESPLYDIYWEHILDSIISKGDAPSNQDHHRKESEVELAAREISQLLQPLAVLMSTKDIAFDESMDDDNHTLIRDAWFNIVVHGIIPTTARGKRYVDELRAIAIHSPALVLEDRGEQDESDIELNTILRRGMSSERESQLKKQLVELVPSRGDEIRSLSYRKLIFLLSAYVVETLRADAGDCTKALMYFLEPSMRRGDMSRAMEGVTNAVMDRYLKKILNAANPTFSAQYAASQLSTLLTHCCHRIERVQQAAYACTDRLIREIPSALGQKSSLFALLELLSLMYNGCLEAQTDPYNPRSIFKSARGQVQVQLSDDYAFRRHTLDNLQRKARAWLSAVIDLAPADVKGLLQTYLSEYDDDGAYGHVSKGRSFALEMGCLIPKTDQKLSSLDGVGDSHINTASDFVAQYTTRQEYRYTDALPDHSMEWNSFMRFDRRPSLFPTSDSESADALTALAHILKRIQMKKPTPLDDVRDILRRAAALLCSSSGDECAVVHYLVSIPFALFTKPSIKLGVSLWLGVMNESPRVESRLLTEIAQQWEYSIQKNLGLFNPAITSPDPFFVKEEFAPTDDEYTRKRLQQIHNLLSPHTRLLQFFASHYNSTRLGNTDTQKIFLRLLDVTLDRLKSATAHPMAREIRFQIVLFGLQVLKSNTTMGAIAQWRLKDKLLSAALSWFSAAPRWSFGSNILQLKTEIRLLADVMATLKATSFIGANPVGTIKSLQPKEQLLLILLESEQQRLSVWVYPLAEPARSQVVASHANKVAVETALLALVRTAWAESPSLAIELTTRFPYPRVYKEVRWLILNFPAKAVSEPEALPVLLGGLLPTDVSFQLKVNLLALTLTSLVANENSTSYTGHL